MGGGQLDFTRRRVLQCCGSAGLISIVGCLGLVSDESLPENGPDWPQYKANPEQTGYAGTTGPRKDVREQWQFETDSAVRSSPVVVGGTNGVVFFGNDDGVIYAVTADTGEERWRFETNDAVRSTPAVVDGTLYVGLHDQMLALDAASGSEQWRVDVAPGGSNPTVVQGESVYVCRQGAAFGIGGIAKLDSSNGDVQSKFATDTTGGLTAAAVGDQTVYVGSEEGSLSAYDIETGDVKWSSDVELGLVGPPALADETVYVVDIDATLRAFDPSDGTIHWAEQLPGVSEGSPAVIGGAVYLGDTQGTVHCLATDDGERLWQADTGNWITPSPAVTDTAVYVCNNDGAVYAIDQTEGEILWQFATGGQLRTSPAVVDGTAFVGSDDGSLYALAEDS
nr:PQQ-binding-like beta-propeller repeat protein [Natrialba asiatica]